MIRQPNLSNGTGRMPRVTDHRPRCQQAARSSDSTQGTRGGLTLLEILLAVAIFFGSLVVLSQLAWNGTRAAVQARLKTQAIILAVAWPNVLRLTGQQSLIDSSEKVRSLAASARVHAIDSGLVYQFRYEPGGRHFVAVPFEREFESVGPNARGTGTALGRFSKASGTLPEGVTFAAPTLLNSASSGTATAGALGQKLQATALSGLPDAGKLESVSWSGPILFQPDGSAGDAALDLVDRRNQRITVRVRGVTGAVSVSRLHQLERP